MLTGVTTDISHLLNAPPFYTEVYYPIAEKLSYSEDPKFPSATLEAKGRMVGFGENVVGTVMTYKILTDDTQKVIYRSYIRPVDESQDPNKRLESPMDASKPVIEVVKSPRGDTAPMATIDPDDLINWTYLTEPDESGQRFRAKIVQKILDNEEERDKDPAKVKFLVKVDGDTADEIVAYNDILQYLEDEMTDPADKLWHFKDIIAHEGPLTPNDPSYKGSSNNVLVAWEDGSQTFEPLNVIGTDSPVACALYAL